MKKAIYGLVQAVRQWWKKFKDVMSSLNFKPSAADPCLFVKKNMDKGTNAFLLLYVDDGGIFGTEQEIKEIIQALSKDFKIKYIGKLEHFVGCHVIQKGNTI